MGNRKGLRNKFRPLPFALRVVLSVGGVLLCVWSGLNSWRSGASRLLTYHGRSELLLVQSDKAIHLTPDDPEAHSGRAFALLNLSQLDEALVEYERAVALRPKDYFLWLELGRARDLANDESGAIEALRKAATLAPDYAEPRWQLGNVLFRAGRVDEGFTEMRRAALSDPALLPNLIDLAWGASGGDAASVVEVLSPLNQVWKLELAKFFVRHGKSSEAMALFREAGGIGDEDRRAILKELLAAHRYQDAYEVWSNVSGSAQGSQQKGSVFINDGGFEGKLTRNEPGFGWQISNDGKTFRLSLDQREPHGGAQSLRIDFSGDSDPNLSLLSQLILVEPNTRYELHFAARTEDLVSGGLPLILLRDAGKESRVFGQSDTLPQQSGPWREYTVSFTTTEETRAVVISFSRQSCGGQCPIFGRVWLDDFEIEKR